MPGLDWHELLLHRQRRLRSLGERPLESRQVCPAAQPGRVLWRVGFVVSMPENCYSEELQLLYSSKRREECLLRPLRQLLRHLYKDEAEGSRVSRPMEVVQNQVAESDRILQGYSQF